MNLSAKDYLPLDTVVTLQRELCQILNRDADIYGHICLRLIGKPQTLCIAGRTVSPDAQGKVELDIPIEEQRTWYPVEWINGKDTIYMPCGEDDIIVIEP
jgi:hypothetical protein